MYEEKKKPRPDALSQLQSMAQPLHTPDTNLNWAGAVPSDGTYLSATPQMATLQALVLQSG